MRRTVRAGEDSFSELRFEITRRADGFQLAVSSNAQPDSVVTSTFYPPFTAGQIEAELSAVPNTLDEFQRSSPRTSPRDSMKKLGESLFVSLLEGHPGKLYQQALEIAASTSQGIRIKLSLNDTGLEFLPWEFLYDPMRGDFLALSANSPLLRTRPGVERVESIEPPLRILIATSELVPMDAEAEVHRIEALKEKGAVFETRVLRQTTRINFLDAVPHEQFHILHIIANGRAEYRAAQGSAPYVASALDFVGDSSSSLPAPVDTKYLRYLCSNKKDLRLICLSGDYTDQMASQLAEVCPAVIGWRGVNSNGAYVSFSNGLYSSLLLGQPLEIAMTQARQRVDLDQPGGKEWGMPVCYLQAPHGAYFPNSRRPTLRSARSIDPILEQQKGLKDSSNTRSWKKLYALLEMEHRNLADIEEQKATYPDDVPSILEEQHNATKARIDQLESQLKELS